MGQLAIRSLTLERQALPVSFAAVSATSLPWKRAASSSFWDG
jgi:hypothetical protein